MTPKRIQRKRTKGYKTPPNTIYVGRPSKYGNPFRVVKLSDGYWSVKTNYKDLFNTLIENCRPAYKTQIEAQYDAVKCFEIINNKKDYSELKGKNLSCFCKNGTPCHADVILKLANK